MAPFGASTTSLVGAPALGSSLAAEYGHSVSFPAATSTFSSAPTPDQHNSRPSPRFAPLHHQLPPGVPLQPLPLATSAPSAKESPYQTHHTYVHHPVRASPQPADADGPILMEMESVLTELRDACGLSPWSSPATTATRTAKYQQAQVVEGIHERHLCAELNINGSLEANQVQTRTSYNSSQASPTGTNNIPQPSATSSSTSLGVARTGYVVQQMFDEMPQCYGLHNLTRHSLFRADGTEQSYFTLPVDYPLERSVHEPVFVVCDDTSDGCSTESVHVFTGTPEQLTNDEEQHENCRALKCFSKPIFSPERPTVGTVGVFSLTDEQKHDNELISLCVSKASYNTSSEEAADFIFPHRPVIYADRSIKLTNEKSTQAAPILFVQGATMHCADESYEINTKKQDIIINKHVISDSKSEVLFLKSGISLSQHPCDLNNDKEDIPLDLGSVQSTTRCSKSFLKFYVRQENPILPCIWDPGIDWLSHKKLHLFSWIPLSAIIIPQQLHNKNISSIWEFSLEKGRQVQWDPDIQVMNDGITSNSTRTTRDAFWKITEDCFADQELMANSPMEHVTPPMSPSAAETVGVTVKPAIAAQAADVQDYTLELQRHGDPRECNYSVLKAFDSLVTRPDHFSIEHSLTDLRLLWDPGAPLPPLTSKTQHYGQALQPTSHATILAGSSITHFSGCKWLPFWVQNIYVFWESEIGMTTYFSWDPGVLRIKDTMLDKCSWLYWYEDIKFNGIALWLINFNPP